MTISEYIVNTEGNLNAAHLYWKIFTKIMIMFISEVDCTFNVLISFCILLDLISFSQTFYKECGFCVVMH